MLQLTSIQYKDNKPDIKNEYDLFEITKVKMTTAPLTITMKKSLSSDTFWPNTPPSNSPDETFLESMRQFFKKNIKKNM